MDLSKLINGDISIVTWICERRYMPLHIRFLAFFIAFFRAVIQAQRGRVWSSSMVLEIYGVIQLHASLHTTSLAPLGWDGAPFPFLFFVRSDALFGQRLTYCWVNLSSTNCGCNCLPSQFPHLVVTSILERGGESMHLADGGHCFTSVQL